MFKPEALKHYREKRGLTQSALALKMTNECGDELDGGQISDYERGKHTPGGDRLRNLAKALDISIDNLFEAPPVAL